MTNYQSVIARLNRAKTVGALQLLENSLERLYLAGVFNTDTYLKLDGLVFHKIGTLIDERHEELK